MTNDEVRMTNGRNYFVSGTSPEGKRCEKYEGRGTKYEGERGCFDV